MSPKHAPESGHPLWFKDAVIYEVHVKSFCDADGDGIGDFKGMTGKLDYLQDLGVTAIWLLPFYPSPLKDDGYDIADYRKIHPDYGTLKDFRTFLREAHKRGVKVITELVLNHTSDAHAWFKRARKAGPRSKARDFYVWSPDPDKYADARIIFKDFETSNWTWDHEAQSYFWHRFYSHQPDLNFDNPQVEKEIFKIIDFWLDMGVDGLRLDAVPYIYEREGTNCENLPETFDILKRLRAHIDTRFNDRMLLAEANQWPEDAARYFGDGDACQMCFHFPLMPRMFMAVHMEDRFPIIDIMDQTPTVPQGCQWAVFLRNHDELTLEMVTDEERDYMYNMYARDPRARINLGIRRRLAPLLDNDRKKMELMNVMLMTMPGSPVLYYGDEIGMGDNFYLGDRDGVRTPMQWSADKNAGFSKSNPQRLYLPVVIDPEYHYESVNVENQQRNHSSLLWWTKSFLAMRKRYACFGHGSIQFLMPDNPHVLAYLREHESETVLVVINLSRFPQSAALDLSEHAGSVPEDVFSRGRFPAVTSEPYYLTLNSHGYYIFALVQEAEGEESWQPDFPVCPAQGVGAFLDSSVKRNLEAKVLPAYLKRRGLLRSRAKDLLGLSIMEALPMGSATTPIWLLVDKAEYAGGPPEYFNMLISYVFGDKAERLKQEQPMNVICVMGPDKDKGIVFEGLLDQTYSGKLLAPFIRRQNLKGRMGEVAIRPGRFIAPLRALATRRPVQAHLVSRQGSTIISYDEDVIFKFYKRAGHGMNPEVEMLRFLTEKADFPHVARYLGSLSYNTVNRHVVVVAVIKQFVRHEGTARGLFTASVNRFLENALAAAPRDREAPRAPRSSMDAALSEPPDLVRNLIGEPLLALAELLGRRTAQMHMALAGETDDPAFAPEPFDKLYRRSVYQEIQGKAKQVLMRLEKSLHTLPDSAQAMAREVLAAKREILARYQQFRETPIRGRKIRVHGDYNLDHILHTGRDFVVVDFQGDKDKPLSARRLKRSSLRDVADMVRSLNAVSHYALFEADLIRPEDRESLAPWLRLWHVHVSGAFLRAYLETAGDREFLPESPEHVALYLDCLLLDLAFEELERMLKHKQGLVRAPLAAAVNLLGW